MICDSFFDLLPPKATAAHRHQCQRSVAFHSRTDAPTSSATSTCSKLRVQPPHPVRVGGPSGSPSGLLYSGKRGKLCSDHMEPSPPAAFTSALLPEMLNTELFPMPMRKAAR